MEASRDELVDWNDLKQLAKNLPKPPQYFVLKGAGHFAFLPLSIKNLEKSLQKSVMTQRCQEKIYTLL